jgi:hypothetical protein
MDGIVACSKEVTGSGKIRTEGGRRVEVIVDFDNDNLAVDRDSYR